MDDRSTNLDDAAAPNPPSTPDCPLPRHQQTRNLLLFAILTGASYLMSPIGYVGPNQAALCNELGADATQANRTVLTYNRRHFRRLHRQDPNHGGIISCSRDDDLDALAARIDQALAAAGPLAGQHIRVNRPPVP